ncbi:hypothetical protein EI291_14410 [Hymenobacter rigui]|uniref:FAD-dependent urate hydroxylase HpyO/Asp monooxygenase CreE-like FAD/NAD(P)-binding domain-containing protein n=2 Tax=Hymenobacter rigui TaxID=334424 RepID=A0A3R9V6E6_9BACT|nr:hypothetical protein EI291_14410 [Hymenobacter rigui]
MLAVQLARLSGDLPYACDVHLVEPRPVPGPGLAYTARRPEYLLNVRSQFLSAFPDQPDHFQNWLRLTSSEICQQSFCSRQSYGRYMQQLVSQVLEWPSLNGFRFTWHNQTARSVVVQPDSKAATVQLSDGTELLSEYVVLALGNFPPPPPTTRSTEYLAHANFHGNPWAQGALRNIDTHDSVLLIGTGLTAIDVLLGLRADGHQGTVTAVSGHGRWPAAHEFQQTSYPDFYASELAGADTVLAVLQTVRRHVRIAKVQGINWRTVLDTLRPHLGRIWAGWPLPEQARFLRHLAGIWSVVRHRSPPQNASIISEMLQSGQVQSEVGRVRDIVPMTKNLRVTVQKGQEPPRQLIARHVIACTGPLLDYSRIQEPLVVGLRTSGNLQPDELHLGIQTDAYGALLNAQGQASEVLFTLGPSRRPAFFESTAVPELREQAVELARELGRRLLENRATTN